MLGIFFPNLVVVFVDHAVRVEEAGVDGDAVAHDLDPLIALAVESRDNGLFQLVVKIQSISF